MLTALKKRRLKKSSVCSTSKHKLFGQQGAHTFILRNPKDSKATKKFVPLDLKWNINIEKIHKAITIKQNGEMRIIENEGIREELPEIFLHTKKLESLLGMDESEGRNNGLFAHRMKIHELEQWQSILRFINNHIFAQPLPEEEFQTISRDVQIDARSNSEPEVAAKF